MPTYPVRLGFHQKLIEHVPLLNRDIHNPFGHVVFDRPELQVPGDVEITGDIGAGVGVGGFRLQKGKLVNEVVATFPDGFQLMLPINAGVRIATKPDGSPAFVMPMLDMQGQPRLVAGGGRRRRSQRRRRVTRRRRYSRRR